MQRCSDAGSASVRAMTRDRGCPRYLRGYMYDFIQMDAPKWNRNEVTRSLQNQRPTPP